MGFSQQHSFGRVNDPTMFKSVPFPCVDFGMFEVDEAERLECSVALLAYQQVAVWLCIISIADSWFYFHSMNQLLYYLNAGLQPSARFELAIFAM